MNTVSTDNINSLYTALVGMKLSGPDEYIQSRINSWHTGAPQPSFRGPGVPQDRRHGTDECRSHTVFRVP